MQHKAMAVKLYVHQHDFWEHVKYETSRFHHPEVLIQLAVEQNWVAFLNTPRILEQLVHEPYLHMLLSIRGGKKSECFSKTVINTDFSEIKYALKNTEKNWQTKVTGSIFHSVCSTSIKKKKIQTKLLHWIYSLRFSPLVGEKKIDEKPSI